MKSSEEEAIPKKSVFRVCAERVVRFAVAVPLLLCALTGFVVAAPLWLVGWVLKVLGFDRKD